MPDPIARPQFLLANQFMVRQETLNNVLTLEPPPTNQAQPLGNTPLWCQSTPDGSNNQIFYEASTANAFYFPSFVIDEDDQGNPKVKFTQPDKSKPGYLLTITLKKLDSTDNQKAIAAGAGRSLTVCPARYYDTTVVQLSYISGPQTRQLMFDQITYNADDLVCVAHITGKSKVGEVVGAIINTNADPSTYASLTVTRTIAAVGVAAGTVPAPPPAPPAPPSAPSSVTVAPFSVDRQAMFRRAMVQPVDTTPVEPIASRFIVAREAMVDRIGPIAAGTIDFHHEPPVSTPPPGTPLYIKLLDQKVVSTINPIWYNLTVFAYMISDISGVTPTQAGYKPFPLPGYERPFFRDINDPNSFCYLPDAFKIARSVTPPFLPFLSAKITGTKLEDAQATVFFTALPVVDMQKVQAAQALIQQGHPGDPITMQPLPTPKNIQYGLFLPGAIPFARSASVALDQPLKDTQLLSLDDFQTVFTELTTQFPHYLQGTITVPISDTSSELVPFTARADDFPGVYFQQTRSIDGAGTAIKLALINSVESPVKVDALPILASRAGSLVSCSVLYDPSLPATIAAADDGHPAGGTLTVTVTPASGPIDDTLDLVVDQSQCRVVPDAASLLRAVLDPNVPVRASTPVNVRVPTPLFGSDTDPAKKISFIGMTFLNGNTILFSRPTDQTVQSVLPDQQGEVSSTVFDYLLRKAGGAASPIKYKLRITYASSGHSVETDWQTAPGNDFVLDLP